MRIIALTATDSHPKYLECVPYFLDFWKSARSSDASQEFVPVVAKVVRDCDNDTSMQRGIQTIHVRDDIDTAFAAQCIRLALPQTMDADFVVTTDVDMFPLNMRVIEAGLKAAENRPGSIVVVRDVLPVGEFPICYTIAAPSVWSKIVEGDPRSWLEALWDDSSRPYYDGAHGGSGWFTDQRYLFNAVTSAEATGVPVIRLTDSETGHRRLDRAHHRPLLAPVWLGLVALGYFTDYHVHHPVARHRRFLRGLLRAAEFQRRSRASLRDRHTTTAMGSG